VKNLRFQSPRGHHSKAAVAKALMRTIIIILALREIKAQDDCITGGGFATGVSFNICRIDYRD
jgi:hypothetical protein